MALLIISLVASLLPLRYRSRLVSEHDVSVRRGALFSGMLQMLACVAVFIVRYIFFLQSRMGGIADAAIRKGAEEALANQQVQLGAGILTMLEYTIQPITLLIIYFAFEGLLRWFAAVISGEVIPSLPLQVIAWIHGSVEKKVAESRLGPLIEDIVLPGTGSGVDLSIASCRPREWTELTTIAYRDELYELAHLDEGEPPRRFLYRLRKAPPQKLVRGLHHYATDELLPKVEEKRS